MRADELLLEAREAVLRSILDILAAVLAGFQTSSAEGTRRVARNLYGDGAAAVWFSGETITAVGAALCNSAAASVLDLDDGNRIARGHPGAAVIPAAFATAAEVGATVEELLAAIVVGYEVSVRVASAREFHARSGMWCGYGAVAAAGRLRRTAPGQMSHALAIAGITAPHVLSTNGGSRYSVPVGNDVKEGIPWATVTGMTALYLAEAGLIGPEDILDHAPHYASDRIVDDLGQDPVIRNTYFKLYSCCRHIHAPIDAFNELVDRHSLSTSEIVSVEVHIYEGALLLSNRRKPENLVDVQFSIPYCIGLTAVMGPAVMLPLTNDVLNNPDVTDIANKVTLHLDSDLDRRFPEETLARIVVRTATDRFESPVTAPRGEASDPLSWQDLQNKFRTATRKVMVPHQQESVLEAVDRLVQGDIDPLLNVFGQSIDIGLAN